MQHVAYDAERVVRKERRDLPFVVLDLLVGIRIVGLRTGRRLQLEYHDGKAIYEDDDVRSLVRAALNVCPLVDDVKGVALWVIGVDEFDNVRTVFCAIEPAYLYAALQHFHENLVLCDERTAFDFLEFGDGTLDGAAIDARVDGLERILYGTGKEGVVISVGRSRNIGTIQILITQFIPKKFDHRLLVGIFVHVNLLEDELRGVGFYVRDGHGALH